MRRTIHLLVLLVACALGIGAATRVNLVTQVKGILVQANGGTGVATANAGTIFSGPLFGSAAAPAFNANALFYPNMPHPGNRRIAYGVATAGGTSTTGFSNLLTSFAASSVTVHAATTTDPAWASRTVASGGNSNLGGDGNKVFSKHVYTQWNVKLDRTTNMRQFWITSDSATNTGWNTNDDRVSNFMGFRFSSVAGDTNFMCINNDNTATPSNIQSSGVLADTNFHEFEYYYDSSANLYYLIDGVLVCTATTRLPTTTAAAVLGMVTVDTNASATNQNYAWVYEEWDP